MDKPSAYVQHYKNALLNNIIPFWEKHSRDKVFGGYYTCLDRDGSVYDTDKFVGLQARQAWFFGMIYNKLDKNEQWLDMAKTGMRFLKRHGLDENFGWYFALDREGTPITRPYHLFAACHAVLAFKEFFNASNEEVCLDTCTMSYKEVMIRRNTPKYTFDKSTGARPLKHLGLTNAVTFMLQNMRTIANSEAVESQLDISIHEIMDLFYQPEAGMLFENIQPDGSFSDSLEGRLIVPGHTFEALWLMMDTAHRRNNRSIIQKCLQILFNTLDYAWDGLYGGLLFCLDYKKKPVKSLEWDQKHWWPHCEALTALAKAYAYTQDPACLEWFTKVHNYAWAKFPDPRHGEWFGYLNRQGDPILTAKGGKWKGCCHLPRSLYFVWQAFESMNPPED